MDLTVWTGLLIAVLVFAAVGDIRSHRIPNELCYAVFGLFFVSALFGGLEASIWSHLLSFAITFLVTAILFYRGLFGGGDTKLISAVSVWVPLALLPKFMIGVAIAGGIWGLMGALFAIVRVLPEGKDVKDMVVQAGKTKVSYGPAILAGACFVIFTN